MTNPWFKFYGGEYLTDLKMKSLSASKRSCWITLLCYGSQSNGIVKYLSEDQLKIDAGIPIGSEEYDNTQNVLENFVKLDMITLDNGLITIKNWGKRQESPLSPYERVKKYRDKKRNDNDVITDDNANDNDRREEKRREEKRRERGDESPTPSQEAKSFFNGNFEPILQEFIEKTHGPPEQLRNEFSKFILYWTESNKSGTKKRWEQQATFEVKRRLATWLGNVKNFQQKVGSTHNQPNYVL